MKGNQHLFINCCIRVLGYMLVSFNPYNIPVKQVFSLIICEGIEVQWSSESIEWLSQILTSVWPVPKPVFFPTYVSLFENFYNNYHLASSIYNT